MDGAMVRAILSALQIGESLGCRTWPVPRGVAVSSSFF